MSTIRPRISGDAVVPLVLFIGTRERRDRLADRLHFADVITDVAPVGATSTLPAATCAVVEHAPPAFDGFAVLRSLRVATPDIPIVFVADATLLRPALAAGATDFVPAVDGATRLLAARIDALCGDRSDGVADGASVPTDVSAPSGAGGAALDHILRPVTAELEASHGRIQEALDALDDQPDTGPTPGTTTPLEDARAATNRLGTTLDGLHQYLAAGSTTRCDPVDLSTVVTDALATLRPVLDGRGATILVGGLPTVVGDKSLLVALFTELFLNTLRYTDCPPTLVVDAHEGPTTWQLAVTDNGPGFYPSEVETAFEPFTRFHGEVAPEGLGLGLAICRRIAAAHGGSIRLDTTFGCGSTVVVTLPKSVSTKTKTV